MLHRDSASDNWPLCRIIRFIQHENKSKVNQRLAGLLPNRGGYRAQIGSRKPEIKWKRNVMVKMSE